MAPIWVYVRATINTAGVKRGDEFWIDAMKPELSPLLEARYLVPIDAPPDDPGPDVEPRGEIA